MRIDHITVINVDLAYIIAAIRYLLFAFLHMHALCTTLVSHEWLLNVRCVVLYVQLIGSDICRQHCAVEYVNGAVVIMPLDRSAAVHVENSRIYSATPLVHGASVLVGSKHLFQFVDPMTSQVS